MTIPNVSVDDAIEADWGNAVADAVNDYVLGEWASFTPTFGNLTIGNGSVSGGYCVVPGGVWVSASFVMGTTTAGTGGLYLNLTSCPAISGPAAYPSVGTGRMIVGATDRILFVYASDSSANAFCFYDGNNIADDQPITWADGGEVSFMLFVPRNPT